MHRDSGFVGLNGAQEFALLTSSSMKLMLLVEDHTLNIAVALIDREVKHLMN